MVWDSDGVVLIIEVEMMTMVMVVVLLMMSVMMSQHTLSRHWANT